jgi:phospholipase A-2-activating protein
VRTWSVVENNDENITISEGLAPLYHSHWITAVAQLNPNCHPHYPSGLTITGCMDNVIRLFDGAGNLVGQLVGHEKPVISFSWTENFSLVSGSWDGTARKWNLQSFLCTMICKGHENGVHVLCLDNETLVTVSTGEQVNNKPANFRLRLWSLSDGQMLGAPIEDHGGPIRSVFSIPGIGFGTTSNDGTLCFRSPDGQCVGLCTHDPQEEGYPPFLLGGSAIRFPDNTVGGAVTCGEDGSVVVWKGTEFFQSIPHPACVWAVSTIGTQGEDIITACHDGFLRIFSRNSSLGDRPASLELQSQFDTEVDVARMARRKGPTQEEIQKSPKWGDRLSIPGMSEGQVSDRLLVCLARSLTHSVGSHFQQRRRRDRSPVELSLCDVD